MSIIKYQDIKMQYKDKVVIENFSLDIDAKEFVTMIGSSGCGKTTLLKMVNGLIQPTQGKVYVHGVDIQKEDMIKLRRTIGYAIQGNVLFPHMSVEQNICYVPNLLNKKDRKKTTQALHKWMEIVGLPNDLLNRYPDELSGGQQQRVGIARALAASPDILLMDEPFGAVDEITRASLQDEIKSIHQQTDITVLFVTHDIKEAMKLGTKMLVMDQGALQQYDDPQTIAAKPKTPFVKKLIQMI